MIELEKKIDSLMVDMASIKTDVTWLKRLFTGVIIVTGVIFGVDTSGMVF